jgi:hypothetical protein
VLIPTLLKMLSVFDDKTRDSILAPRSPDS